MFVESSFKAFFVTLGLSWWTLMVFIVQLRALTTDDPAAVLPAMLLAGMLLLLLKTTSWLTLRLCHVGSCCGYYVIRYGYAGPVLVARPLSQASALLSPLSAAAAVVPRSVHWPMHLALLSRRVLFA
jgi:hypothetical protein